MPAARWGREAFCQWPIAAWRLMALLDICHRHVVAGSKQQWGTFYTKHSGTRMYHHHKMDVSGRVFLRDIEFNIERRVWLKCTAMERSDLFGSKLFW